MMSVSRINTVVLRYFYGMRRDLGRLFEFIYWPTIDIFLFGFLGKSLDTGQETLVMSLMAGLVLWQVATRTNMDISRNLVQELWDDNLVNMLSTPLRLTEWLMGLVVIGLAGTIFTVFFGAFLVKVLLGPNIFVLGLPLIIFTLLLVMSGWILGLIGASFLVSWGQRFETMIWAISWLPAPFCGVYYQVEVLPQWAQVFSKTLPMTYAFEGVRKYIATGSLDWHIIGISFVLNLIYLLGMVLIFCWLFRRSKNRGFASLG